MSRTDDSPNNRSQTTDYDDISREDLDALYDHVNLVGKIKIDTNADEEISELLKEALNMSGRTMSNRRRSTIKASFIVYPESNTSHNKKRWNHSLPWSVH